MIGNEEDFTAALGFAVEGVDAQLNTLETGSFRRMIEKAVQEFPNFAVVATTLRTVTSATVNVAAIAWSHNAGFVEATRDRGSRFWTVSPEATASPRASSTECSSMVICSRRSSLVPRTALL